MKISKGTVARSAFIAKRRFYVLSYGRGGREFTARAADQAVIDKAFPVGIITFIAPDSESNSYCRVPNMPLSHARRIRRRSSFMYSDPFDEGMLTPPNILA
jgi:hypothetical protein